MKRWQHGFIALFGLVLLAPSLQMVCRVIPEPYLVGFTNDATLLPLTWSTWSSGRYQARGDAWLQEHIGFRSAGVRTDSQINYSVFGESAIKTADMPIVGKNGQLYAKVYVDEYNRRKETQLGAGAAAFARDLRRLQDGLQKRGKAFVFLIAPSKAEIYPEFIPARHLAPSTRGKESDYQRLLPLLRAEGVHVVDAHALFMDLKQREPWLLFPPGGVHWQAYGMSRVLEPLTRELEAQLGRPLPGIECETVGEVAPSRADGENDLADLMNVWVAPRWSQRVPWARLRTVENRAAFRPRVKMVGDSFMLGMIQLMQRLGPVECVDFYYYFGTRYRYPSGVPEPLDRLAIDWERDLFDADAIIVEINESLLDSRAWGFVDEALKHLDNPPARNEETTTP